MHKFRSGLFWLWVIMASGLASVLNKDLLLMFGAPGVPPADLIALTDQFNVLLMPTLALVCIWFWQRRGSPRWAALAADIKHASTNA